MKCTQMGYVARNLSIILIGFWAANTTGYIICSEKNARVFFKHTKVNLKSKPGKLVGWVFSLERKWIYRNTPSQMGYILTFQKYLEIRIENIIINSVANKKNYVHPILSFILTCKAFSEIKIASCPILGR